MKAKTKNFLGEIVRLKKLDLIQENRITYKSKKSDSNFLKIFRNKQKVGLIAEIKFASPTNLNIGNSKDLLQKAKQYEDAGADAISIITEKHFFKGDISYIKKVKKYVMTPILQKDFVIEPKQIFEAKEIGSDALLLIARLVDKETLKQFVELCLQIGIEPVVEIANEEDLQKAIVTKVNIIAVNARDLETFEIDVKKASELMSKIPDNFVKFGFSGIHSSMEVAKYQRSGAKGVLVGTSLMQSQDIKKFIKSLRESTVKVKICGIQTLEEAQDAIEAGADFLGFIFVKNSTRAIDKKKAKKIIKKMRDQVSIVGVFKNSSLEEINSLSEEMDFDFVQLHGDETPIFCQKVKRPVIKAFGLSADFSIKETVKQMRKYKAAYFLIDREKPGVGNSLSPVKSAALAKKFPLFFAGGLNPENVGKVVKTIHPYAVDVISGVKTNDKFDSEKMKKFVMFAKGVNL